MNLKSKALMGAIFAVMAIGSFKIHATDPPKVDYSSRVESPPTIEEKNRGLEQVAGKRKHYQDSVMAGGNIGAGGSESLDMNPCKMDPTQPGCKSYCSSNPTALGCFEPPLCVAPSPTTAATSRIVKAKERTVPCGYGQLGTRTEAQGQAEAGTITTTYSCPSKWGPFASSSSTKWSGSYTASGEWKEVSNNCTAAPMCQPPAPQNVGISRPASAETRQVNSCPAGYTGTVTESRNRVENGTRTTSYSCPDPYGAPKSSTSDRWLGTYTPTGNWSQVSSSCVVSNPKTGTWILDESNWGYSDGQVAYDEWSWYEAGTNNQGRGGGIPPIYNNPCAVGSTMTYRRNDGWPGGDSGFDIFICVK